jgi:nitrite reductase/ring-hydroxylating ferredoxin subunit
MDNRTFPVTDAWYPIELTGNIRAGAITQAFLFGQELAVWRNQAGQVMVWENRCAHRSVRLTLGRIVDDQLSCGYHGWRYGSTGACTYIPAHPSAPPPRSACVKTFPAKEKNGLVWASLASESPTDQPVAVSGTFCRSYVRDGDFDEIAACFDAIGFQQVSHAVFRAEPVCDQLGRTLLVAPMNEKQYLLHLWIDGEATASERTAENARLKSALRHVSRLEVAA